MYTLIRFSSYIFC